MEEKNWLALALEQAQVSQLLETNPYTQKYGLALSPEDAHELMEKRKQTLADTKRVEFGQGILPKIIYEFCDSAYIHQSDYAETLAGLQDIFFHFKNELLDEVLKQSAKEIWIICQAPVCRSLHRQCGPDIRDIKRPMAKAFTNSLTKFQDGTENCIRKH